MTVLGVLRSIFIFALRVLAGILAGILALVIVLALVIFLVVFGVVRICVSTSVKESHGGIEFISTSLTLRVLLVVHVLLVVTASLATTLALRVLRVVHVLLVVAALAPTARVGTVLQTR